MGILSAGLNYWIIGGIAVVLVILIIINKKQKNR
jgi:hypothetical protein